MTINTENDHVEVYEDVEGLWRWRRVDLDNGRILSVAAESYVSKVYAFDAAKAYNPGIDVEYMQVGDA